MVACEESQAVCTAFRERGHEAYSCDIQEPSGGHPEWHILGDALEAVKGGSVTTMDGLTHDVGKWDLLIAHPPCTYLSNVATRQYSLKCNSPEKVVNRWVNRANAAVFFMQFILADVPRIAVENPVGFMNSSYRKADQIIHPYYFAESVTDDENYHEKRTCLWLKGVPPLIPTNEVAPPERVKFDSGKSMPKWYADLWHLPKEERSRLRSQTFPGFAKAMASQWGNIKNNKEAKNAEV